MRHSSSLIKEIRSLRKDNFTLTEIVEKTGLSKTTIFHHIKNIKHSFELDQKIKNSRLISQNISASKRRGKSIKEYTFNKPEEWNEQFVNLIAHFTFDGRITRLNCTYFNRSSILVDEIIKLMNICLGVNDYKIYSASGGVKRLAYNNVEIASFIKRKSDELLEYISCAPKKHQISFLNAFFDDEGCVSFSKSKRLVRGYQKSEKILLIIHDLLSNLGIKSYVDAKYYEINVSRKDNLLRFQKLINFTPGLCVNGNRSNSIWKKDLEKREILNMAINSYLK